MLQYFIIFFWMVNSLKYNGICRFQGGVVSSFFRRGAITDKFLQHNFIKYDYSSNNTSANLKSASSITIYWFAAQYSIVSMSGWSVLDFYFVRPNKSMKQMLVPVPVRYRTSSEYNWAILSESIVIAPRTNHESYCMGLERK